MKCLTLHQPWASLIASGQKTVETRSWRPPASLVGERIAIHAGRRVAAQAGLHPETALAIAGIYGPRWRESAPRGAVVCTVRIAAAHQVRRVEQGLAWVDDGVSYRVSPHGDYSPGRWLWLLDDLICFERPVPAIGHQRLWNWRDYDPSDIL